MQPDQETATTSLPNLQCPSHPHPLSTFCTHQECSSRLLCEECQQSHSQDHKDTFKTYQDLLENDEILKNLHAAKEKSSDPAAYLQQVDSYFQALLAKMTEKINEMSQQVQGAVKESLKQEDSSEKITSLEENLTTLKSSLTSSESPQIQQLEDYLKAYIEAVKITEEQPPSPDSSKLDFSSISNLCQDFEKQADLVTSKFLTNFQKVTENPTPIPTPTPTLTFEKIIPIPTKGINPGCLAEIKNNCFVLGAMDGKVSVWDADTLQVIREKSVHNLRVTSLLYLAGYDLLISAGEDRRLCVSRFGKGNDFMTFMQTPQDANVTCLTELGNTGMFVGLYGQTEIGIWCIKMTKFKGNEYYEILPEGKIQTNQKVKAGGKIVNIPGKDMIAVEFEIGLIGFFCLKQRKLMFGIYAEALLSGFWYCEKRQKLYAQISPETVRVWDYSTDKVNLEGNIEIKSKAKEPYFTLVAENNVLCCGGSGEIIAVDLATRKETSLELLNNFKCHGLVYLQASKKLIATDLNHENLTVIKVKENNLISF